MADGETNHAVESGNVSEMGSVDGFNFVSFENGEQVDYFVEYPRKRTMKRPLAALALPIANDTETRLKKRSRKGEKRFIEDKLDGFTFVSAFSLYDFDDYDKIKPKCIPPASTKRKATTKVESATSKKPRKSLDSTSDTLVAFVDAFEEGSINLIPDKDPMVKNGIVSANTSVKKKSLSPLTKSALVRLKKINVSNLKKSNVAKNKQVENVDCQKEPLKVNQRHTSRSRRKQSFNLKVPHMQIDKFNGAASKQPDTITISDSDDMRELDVCGIDESMSSSEFILSNMKTSSKKNLNPVVAENDRRKRNEKIKPKKKPCPTCCAHPCRIVGAKRVKSSGFPSFDVSYTTKCKLHPAGEIIVHDLSAEKVDICIQATSSDIKMHLDFAKRFPYKAISVVSCQPSLDDEDLTLPAIPSAEATISVSETHRVTELKRREEQHGLYCRLAKTLDISKERASKQWILQTALKEIQNVEAESKILAATMELKKRENCQLRKRWEELSGKPFVPQDEESNAARTAGKSKLLDLYMKYREDMKHESQKKPTEKGEVKLDVACDISNHTSNSNTLQLSPTVSSMKEPIKSMSVNPSQVGHHTKVMQPNSTNRLASTAKHASVGPRLVVHPFHHKPNILRRTPVIPRIDLTNQSDTSVSSDLVERNTNPVTTTGNPTTQVSRPPPSESHPAVTQCRTSQITSQLPPPTQSNTNLTTTQLPPPTQSDTNLTTTQLPPSTRTNTHLNITNLPPPMQTNNYLSTTHFPAPIQSNDHLGSTSLPPTQSTTHLNTTHLVSHTQTGTHIITKALPPTQSATHLNTTHLALPTQNSTHLVTTALPPTQSTTRLSNTYIPPSTQSSVHLSTISSAPSSQSSTYLKTTRVGSTSVSGVTNQNAALPTTSQPLVNQLPSTTSGNNEFVVVSVVVRGKTMVFRIPKTSEGLDMLSRISLMKQMSANSIAKIVKQFSPSNELGHLTMPAHLTIPTTVNTVSPVTIPTTPTQWSAVALAQNSTSSATLASSVMSTATTSCRDGQPSDVTTKKEVVFLDLGNDKPEDEAFSVIPHSSSINLTLNKAGSITGNKIFNLRPPRPRPQTILPKPSNKQTVHRAVPPIITTLATNVRTTIPSTTTNVRTTIPSTTNVRTTIPSTTNVPTTIPSTTRNVPPTIVPIRPPSTRVPVYPLPPKIPLNTSVSHLQTIVPRISDSLLETTCVNDQNVMNDPGICVISNVFSLTNTVLGATPNGLETMKADTTVLEASKTDNPKRQSPDVVK